ncbi:hypothetical protein B0H14DRAFT_3128482 [Mycena olivaceomarginata]|nr:hypothetical protein B0H14DRAFT_3128482 [Mycena olivaceomarginata]
MCRARSEAGHGANPDAVIFVNTFVDVDRSEPCSDPHWDLLEETDDLDADRHMIGPWTCDVQKMVLGALAPGACTALFRRTTPARRRFFTRLRSLVANRLWQAQEQTGNKSISGVRTSAKTITTKLHAVGIFRRGPVKNLLKSHSDELPFQGIPKRRLTGPLSRDPASEVSKVVHISRARGVNEVPAVYSGGNDTFGIVPGSFSDWSTSIFGASQPGGNEPFGTLAGNLFDWSATGLGATYPVSNEPFGTVPGNYYDWNTITFSAGSIDPFGPASGAVNRYPSSLEDLHRRLLFVESAIVGSRWPPVGAPPTFDESPDKTPFPQRIKNEWEITGERPRGRGKQYEVSENGRKLGWCPGALLKGSEMLLQWEEAQAFVPGGQAVNPGRKLRRSSRRAKCIEYNVK